MDVFFYHDSRSLNDATKYYVSLIEKACKTLNIQVFHKQSLKNLKKEDIILTITSKYFALAKLIYPQNKTIFWAQGIAPEEYLMYDNANKLKYWFKEMIEKFAVKNSTLLFVVSENMLKHFRIKYNLKIDNYITMPCYNIQYREDIILNNYSNRYERSTFVYAGSLAAWQCIDETLLIFNEIQEKHPNAFLTLLVQDTLTAKHLITKYGLKNVTVKYVEMEELQKEMSQYKYGFLLRKESIVNSVATPTKMNSYLASGVIPIYTSALGSFNKNIDLGKNTLCLNSSDSYIEKAAKILSHMNAGNIDKAILNRSIKSIFINYYDDKKYINIISNKIKRSFIKLDRRI